MGVNTVSWENSMISMKQISLSREDEYSFSPMSITKLPCYDLPWERSIWMVKDA
jgi:hypothetical protein